MGELKDKVVRGTAWTILERFGAQFVEFLVGMVLARLLTPNDFGTVALTAIVFTVARALVDGGFGLALIQKKDADDLDFNSVFYMSMALAALMYVCMWFLAPVIAAFYRVNELVTIIRVSALTFFFNALNSVQAAELNRKMRFDLTFWISIACCLTNAVMGITLALCGFGVWAIIWSGLAVGAVGVVMRWFLIAWRPRLMFSLVRVRTLFSFGWKTTLATVLDLMFSQLSGLLIGRFYTRADLAFVDRGNGLPSRAIMAVESTLVTVAFPALVRLQDDRKRLVEALRRLIRTTTFLVFPSLALIASCAESLIPLLFGDQWTIAVPYMRMSCISFALLPLASLETRALLGVGRSDLVLKQSIVSKLVILLVVLLTLRLGVFVFAVSSLFFVCLAPFCITVWMVDRHLGYSLKNQLHDLLPSASLCVTAFLAAWAAQGAAGVWIGQTNTIGRLVTVAIQGVTFAATYVALARIFRLSALGECRSVVGGLVGRFLWKKSDGGAQ